MSPADREQIEPSPRCGAALHEIDRLLDGGLPIDRAALLERYADVGNELAAHLDIAELLKQLSGTSGARHADLPASATIESFGDYEVMEELGRGGMAVVYKALQKSLDRLVALKFPLAGRFTDSQAASRFRREALALAKMRHPNIVAIHEVGEHAGQSYLAVEYVAGVNLAQLLRDEPPTIRQAVEHVIAIASAIAYAHQCGIVHRDLKPANILVDRLGVVRVADFGLGKMLAADQTLTQTGQILGTLRYMAPEQTDDDEDSSPQSGDIYSIGAILYELLSGRPAFWANSTAALIRQIFEQDPLPLRQLDARIPQDLETVCQKCLSKNPAERYASAGALAEDLQQFLHGRPLVARPIGRVEKLWRWCRRRPVVAGLCAVTALTIVAATTVSTWFGISANRERGAAIEAKERADRNAGASEQLAKRTQREIAMHEIQLLRLPPRSAGWSAEAQQRVAEAAEVECDSQLRNEAVACLTGMDAECTQVWEFRSSSVAFSADGSQLLIGGGFGSRTRLWRIAENTFDESQQTGFGPVAFTSEGDGLQWMADSPWTFSLWNVTRQTQTRRFEVPDVPAPQRPSDADVVDRLMSRVCLCASRDMTLLAASVPVPDLDGDWPEGRGTTFVWNREGKRLHTIDGEASGLSFSPDQALLAVGRSDGRIELHHLHSDPPPVTLHQGINRIHSLDFIRNPLRVGGDPGWMLAAADAGGVVTVWDVERQQIQSRCLGSAWNAYVVRFSPDGMTLAAGGRDGVRLYDFLTGQLLLQLWGTGDYLTDFAFSTDGTLLAASSRSPQPDYHLATTVWSIRYGRGIDIYHGMSGQIAQTCLSSDARLLAVLGQNWDVGVYETAPPRLKYILRGPMGQFADNAALAFSPDNRLLAASAGSEARLWEVASGAVAERFDLPPGLGDQLGFTADGRLLSFRWECTDGRTLPWDVNVSQTPSRALRLRNLIADESHRLLAEIADFDDHVFKTAAHPEGDFFLADGLRRAANGNTPELIAYDGVTGAPLWNIVPNRSECWPVVDPDGGTLGYLDSPDNSASMRRIPSGELMGRLPSMILAIGPQGSDCATVTTPDHAGHQGRGLSWWKDGGATLSAVLGIDFRLHNSSPRFSRDGRLLIFGTNEGVTAVCDLNEIERRLEELQNASGRSRRSMRR